MKLSALTLATLMFLTSCDNVATQQAASSMDNVKLRINLVDAPIDEVKNVFVNIDHIELLVEKGGKQDRHLFGRSIGSIDLLTLRDGVFLPVTELSLPANVNIKQIRLVLKDDQNYLYRSDDSRCDLQTPSQQKSGTKILVKKTLTLEPGFDYKMVIDFDALKSVVLKGNGGCLLKPVLKLKSLMKKPLPEEPAPVEPSVQEPTPVDPPAEEPTPVEPPAEEPAPVDPPAEEPTPVDPPAPVEPEAPVEGDPVDEGTEMIDPQNPPTSEEPVNNL